MLRLLFSLTSRFLFVALLQDKKCLANLSRDNFRQHTEKFFPALQKILSKNGYSLKDIGEIYFTDLPGSQTGQRISLAFVLALQVLNPRIKIYHLNSLLFQVGEKKAISLISIDLKKTKYHVAVYQKTKCLVKPKEIDLNVNSKELNQIKKQFPNYFVYEDFHQISQPGINFPQKIRFLTNFRQLLPCFQLLKTSS